MADRTLTRSDLARAAQRYVDRWLPWRSVDVRALDRTTLREPVPEAFLREVADHFAAQPRRRWSVDLARRYRLLREETLRQYHALLDCGLRIEPWLGGGQPYRDSAHLRTAVRGTSTLYVFLSRDGHGPGPGEADHPMLTPAGVRAGGVDLVHNDLFRAVHDAFGHVMLDNSMGPTGEFRATYCHMTMYSRAVHPVLMAEQVSQVCWFFHGPHLRDDDGRIPKRGDPGWVPPAARPYAEQKVFACPPHLVRRFEQLFREESP